MIRNTNTQANAHTLENAQPCKCSYTRKCTTLQMLIHSKMHNLSWYPSPKHSPVWSHWSYTGTLLLHTIPTDQCIRARALDFTCINTTKRDLPCSDPFHPKQTFYTIESSWPECSGTLWVHGSLILASTCCNSITLLCFCPHWLPALPDSL
jgi:hypothetical protein